MKIPLWNVLQQGQAAACSSDSMLVDLPSSFHQEEPLRWIYTTLELLDLLELEWIVKLILNTNYSVDVHPRFINYGSIHTDGIKVYITSNIFTRIKNDTQRDR